jgi:hypothetical protein
MAVTMMNSSIMTYIIDVIHKWLQYSIVFHVMKEKHHSVYEYLYSIS